MRTFAILLLSSFAGNVVGQGFESCGEQDSCISFFTYEEPTLECKGEAGPPVCQYKICAEVNTENQACNKTTGEPIGHTCLAGDGSSPDPNLCNADAYVEITTGNLLTNGGRQCQTVTPGGVATFSFYDGACSGTVTKTNELSCAPASESLCRSTAGPECVWTVNAPAQCSDTMYHTYEGSGNELTLVLTANMMPESSKNRKQAVTGCTALQNLTIVEELTNGFVDFLQSKLPEHDMRLLEFDTYAECPQYECEWGEKCITYCTTVQIEFEAENFHYLGDLTESSVLDHQIKTVDNFRKIIRGGDLDCFGDDKKMMIALFVESASGGSFMNYLSGDE